MHEDADGTDGVYAYDSGVFRRMLLVGVVVLLGACGGGGGEDTPAPTKAQSRTTDAPPWPLGDNQAERIDEAGLPRYSAEGSKVHYHAHLDVFYNGEPVPVPAGIGVDLDEKVISPLHTHLPSGIVHIEANEAAKFTLAQVFTQWGVRSDLPLTVYVNGVKTGDGLDHVIKGDTQIAAVFGTPPPVVPSTYDCKRSPTDACDRIPQPTTAGP